MSVYSLGEDRPTIFSPHTCWIADTASVVGQVTLNPKVSIWFGAVLRGDNEAIVIGEGTNIQENCILHTDIGYPLSVGKCCTIGHGAILHGCSIGRNCIIGMGAIILNGAEIGDNTIVGAGALVTENKKFLTGNQLLVGSPAKPVRELKLDEIGNLELSATGYQEKARHFKNSCDRFEIDFRVK